MSYLVNKCCVFNRATVVEPMAFGPMDSLELEKGTENPVVCYDGNGTTVDMVGKNNASNPSSMGGTSSTMPSMKTSSKQRYRIEWLDIFMAMHVVGVTALSLLFAFFCLLIR